MAARRERARKRDRALSIKLKLVAFYRTAHGRLFEGSRGRGGLYTSAKEMLICLETHDPTTTLIPVNDNSLQ